MLTSVVGKHAKGKNFVDRIFAASAEAQADAAKFGKAGVVNATLGAIYDEEEKLVCLSSVEKVYRSLPINEICAYANIMGLPDFMDQVMNAVFGQSRPNMEMVPMVTAGGAGGLYCSIWNYTDAGDAVLCADWSWGNYKIMCLDKGRKYATYKMLDDNLQFNHEDLEAKVKELLSKQDSLLYILNTPAHNPTGYSVNDRDFRKIVEILGRQSQAFGKPVTLVLDVAYMDYAGDKEEVRRFFKELERLPESVLAIICYSMSKGFTFYGQRAGAMIGVSKSKEVIQEFVDVNKYTARATWSNCNRGAMKTLAMIYADPKLLRDIETERQKYMAMIKARADVFMAEAKVCGLEIIPYIAGFFISIPHPDSVAVCEELKKEHIYCVPLAAGVRVAVCSIPLPKMKGLAAKIKAAMDKVGKR